MSAFCSDLSVLIAEVHRDRQAAEGCGPQAPSVAGISLMKCPLIHTHKKSTIQHGCLFKCKITLTHCGLVIPYRVMDLGQQLKRKCYRTAISHYLIQWWLIIHIDGLSQCCGNSIANALELQQSCTKPSIWYPGTISMHFLVIKFRQSHKNVFELIAFSSWQSLTQESMSYKEINNCEMSGPSNSRRGGVEPPYQLKKKRLT